MESQLDLEYHQMEIAEQHQMVYLSDLELAPTVLQLQVHQQLLPTESLLVQEFHQMETQERHQTVCLLVQELVQMDLQLQAQQLTILVHMMV